MKYTYLLVDLSSIIIPFIFSFHPKIRFDREWKTFLPAMGLVGLFFLVWDAIFTQWGVWGFTPAYLLGLNIYNLPLEEILFFICIPYACVFTYHSFRVFGINPMGKASADLVSVILLVLLLGLGVVFYYQWYTSVTFILMAATIGVHRFYWKSDYMSNFYFAYTILLIPFFIVNGILTGTGLETQVVWYDNSENLGIRMGTIPVEDTFYGMLLILWIVTLHERWRGNSYSSKSSSMG